MSIGYYGIAHLQEYDYNEQITIYSFNCIKSGVLALSNYSNEDGIFTISYNISSGTFTTNKGKVKNTIKCTSELKVDKFSSDCIQSESTELVKMFESLFNRYLEDNNGMLPLKLGFTC